LRLEVAVFIAELDSAYCIASSFLPRHALLVTALCEARETMKPSAFGWERAL
jgi:hypothetical protein